MNKSNHIHDTGISISEAMNGFKNGTLGRITKCDGCTACCRTYSQIKGVAIIPGTTTCSKVKKSGCKIWHRRPTACSGYSCYVFYMSGVISRNIIENGGKLFSFRIIDTNDVAVTLILFFINRKYHEFLFENFIYDFIADEAAGIILGLAAMMIADNYIFSSFKASADLDKFMQFKSSSDLSIFLAKSNARLPPALDRLLLNELLICFKQLQNEKLKFCRSHIFELERQGKDE